MQRERKGEGHGLGIKDGVEETMTAKTAGMTKLEVRGRNVPALSFHVALYFASKSCLTGVSSGKAVL